MTFKIRSKTPMTLMAVCVLVLCWSQSLTIYAKAYLAEHLIEQAWQETLRTKTPSKPWQWADTWPVAKITFLEQDESYLVLSGSQGNSLAFGPGHVNTDTTFEERGTKIIGGHRDTHFSLLENITIGNSIRIQNNKGEWQNYHVTQTKIADIRNGDWTYDTQKDELHLITCYPFDAPIAGGPLRFVVIANKVSVEQSDNGIAKENNIEQKLVSF